MKHSQGSGLETVHDDFYTFFVDNVKFTFCRNPELTSTAFDFGCTLDGVYLCVCLVGVYIDYHGSYLQVKLTLLGGRLGFVLVATGTDKNLVGHFQNLCANFRQGGGVALDDDGNNHFSHFVKPP